MFQNHYVQCIVRRFLDCWNWVECKSNLHSMGLGVCCVYVNSSIVDEGALVKTSLLHVEDRFIPIVP